MGRRSQYFVGDWNGLFLLNAKPNCVPPTQLARNNYSHDGLQFICQEEFKTLALRPINAPLSNSVSKGSRRNNIPKIQKTNLRQIRVFIWLTNFSGSNIYFPSSCPRPWRENASWNMLIDISDLRHQRSSIISLRIISLRILISKFIACTSTRFLKGSV